MLEVDVLQVRLLGPVTALSPDGPVPLGGGKPRALLAALVLERGRVVPASRLVDVLWPSDPPDSARSLIQTYVSTLRKTLTQHGFPDVIATQPPGYRAQLDRVTVDADLLADLVGQARDSTGRGDHVRAAELLHRAVSLSAGPALAGLGDSPLAGEGRRLDEMLLDARANRFEAEFRVGRLDHLAELTGLVTHYPTNERLRGQLMVVLCRLGRQSDALACYREARSALVEELGVEPGPQLQALHHAILRGEAVPGVAPARTEVAELAFSTTAPAGEPPGALEPSVVVPAHIPPAPTDFTGRETIRQCLVDALRAESPGVHVLAGPGGSGKSALAVWVAQRAASAFPDGQLYADLRGMSAAPATPDEILAGLLRSLGVNLTRLPDDVQERSELYRSLIARRRVLVLFDDAANEQQIRPLLPAGPRCAAVITSRDRLPGLAGAALTELETLEDAEAYELLARIVGAERIRGDVDAANRILTACDNLPLAIRIAGARLATRRHLPLTVLAERLSDERQRLDELAAGDLAVRSSIASSYDALGQQARTALGRLGYFGIPAFSAWVLGWLMDLPPTAAERVLELLVDTHLVEFTGVDPTGVLRYRLHDLVRIYACERAEAEEAPEALREAVSRAIGGWHTLVDRMLDTAPPAELIRRRQPVRQAPLPDRLVDQVLADAAGWLQREEPVTLVGVERAAAVGLHELVCDFVSARMALELEGANRFEFRQRIVNVALDAAGRAGHLYGEATMLAELGQLRYAEDRHSESRRYFGEALSRFRALHDVWGQATTLAGLGISCREPGHLSEALHFLNQAAVLLEALDDAVGIGYVHRVRGSVLLELGSFPAAFADLQLSLQAYQRASCRTGIAYVLRSLGIYHRTTGDCAQSLRRCAESAEIFAELGNELMHSYAVRSHATAQLRMGRAEQALPRLEWALSVARTVGDRWGEAVTSRVIGQLHLGQGRLDLAERFLAAAMALWDMMHAPLWRARTEYDVSLLLRARGDTDAADRAHASALAIFRDRGSREFTELSTTNDNALAARRSAGRPERPS